MLGFDAADLGGEEGELPVLEVRHAGPGGTGMCEGCRAYLDQVRRTITITSDSRDHTVELTPANFDHLLDLFTRQPRDDDGNGDEA